MSDHLRQVHQLRRDERKTWLKAAVFSQKHFTPYVISHIMSMKQQPREKTDVKPLRKRGVQFSRSDVLETEAYPDFKFQHKFSLLVVGPTQCGKT